MADYRAIGCDLLPALVNLATRRGFFGCRGDSRVSFQSIIFRVQHAFDLAKLADLFLLAHLAR